MNLLIQSNPTGNYMFKIDKRNTRTRNKIDQS